MARSSSVGRLLSAENDSSMLSRATKIMNYYKIANIDLLAKKVTDLLPPQRPFFESDQTISEYSRGLFNYEALPEFRIRQQPLLKLIDNKVRRLYNDEEYKNIKLPDQSKGLRAGLVYHQGVLNHPVIIGVDIVANFFRMFDRQANGDILTFSTGNIPLNNFFYRRGFTINGVHVNLYPKKDRNKAVFQYPLFPFDIVGSLKESHQWKLHNTDVQNFLIDIQGIIQSIDFSTCQSMGDQITKINFHLWPKLFSEDIRGNVANWICLEYDDLLSDFLIDTLTNNTDSFLYQILFDKELLQKTLDYFEGKTNAWNEARKMGTHFFWGLVDHEPQRLLLHDNMLRSEDGTMNIEWNPASIIEALKTRKIFSGMFMKYSLLVLYAGMKPFAGYASSNSIAQMQADLSQFLTPYFPKDVEYMKSLVVNNLTSVPVLLHRNNKGAVENFFAFDIMMSGGLSKKYFDKINSAPIKNFMATNLPTMYDYGFNLYGKGDKEDLIITSADLDQLFDKIV